MALFTVEGLEGASKSTSIRTIQAVFNEYQQLLCILREPGGTPLAEELRSLVKNINSEIIHVDTELFMFFAARNQQDILRTIPNLEKGHVLKDRCWWSTFAYQVHKRIDPELFWLLTERIKKKLPFDGVLLLDLDPEIGLQRAEARGELDRIEKNNMDFFHRAREGYLHLAKTEKNTTIIDASRSLEEVQSDVRSWAIEQVTKHLIQTAQPS